MEQTKKSNPVAGLISLLVLGFVGYQVYSCNNASPNSDFSSAEKDQPLYHIDANDLFNLYERNEVSADAAMSGKTVVVTGTVQSIDKDFADAVVVELATSNEYMPARMSLVSGQEAKAGALTKGEKVMISCAKMARIVGSPSGSKCVLNTD
jgi:NAD-dependent DNA ligase